MFRFVEVLDEVIIDDEDCNELADLIIEFGVLFELIKFELVVVAVAIFLFKCHQNFITINKKLIFFSILISFFLMFFLLIQMNVLLVSFLLVEDKVEIK